jgi:ankyrin repeat protein
LQLDALSKCYTMRSLHATLSSLPSTLDETYTQILDKIDVADRAQVYRILRFVCFSIRPLRVEELAAIVQLGDHAEPRFHLEDALFVPEHILDMCSGLLVMSVIKPNKYAPWFIDDDTVVFHTIQLSHFSVKEYLISARTPFWHLDEQKSHILIVQTVTMYYIHVASMPDLCSMSPQDTIIKHSLAQYAAWFTSQHLDSLKPREHPDLLESFRTLLDPDSTLLCNPIASFYLVSWSHVFPQTYAPALSLCVAARLGLPQISQWLLNFDICRAQLLSPPPSLECDPPLSQAAWWGQLDVIEVLLGAGAHTDESLSHAIQTEAHREKADIVQALIHAGGDPSATKSGPWGSGLRAAAIGPWDNDDIVSMLINAGADVNGGDWQSWGSPIQVAAMMRKWGIVKKLADAGANVDLPGPGNLGTALYSAANHGNEEVVQVLIDAGANVDIIGGEYGSAIQAAAFGGHEAVVALLIQNGANVDVRGVVQQRVRYRDGIFVRDDKGNDCVILRYQSALSIAREKGFDGIVRLLEDAGATDFNDQVVDDVD